MNLGGLKLPPIDHQGSKAQQEGQKRPKTHQKQPKMPHTKLLQHAIETHKGGEIIFEHPFFFNSDTTKTPTYNHKSF